MSLYHQVPFYTGPNTKGLTYNDFSEAQQIIHASNKHYSVQTRSNDSVQTHYSWYFTVQIILSSIHLSWDDHSSQLGVKQRIKNNDVFRMCPQWSLVKSFITREAWGNVIR